MMMFCPLAAKDVGHGLMMITLEYSFRHINQKSNEIFLQKIENGTCLIALSMVL